MNEHVKRWMKRLDARIHSDFLRKVKLSLILLLLSSQVFASAVAAQAVNVKLALTNPTIANVIEKLHLQTGYEFSYDADILSQKLSTVSIDVKNERIEMVLSKVFAHSNVSFRIINNRVFLKRIADTEKSKAMPIDADEQQPARKTVSGKILDDKGEPVIGATVIEQGNTSNGTVTDMDGNFTLSVSPNASLRVSYIGYADQEIPTEGKNSFSITMHEDTTTLDEVVVIGFGSQRKTDLTGAISQVKMEDVLGDRPVISASAALQGAIPGLMVAGASSPGQAKSFNIRGTLSINGGSPLVLIDNVEGDINALNPDDIESVSVLKDASSAAIYGARGAGGVILITTKRPKGVAKFQLNYSFSQGWENAVTRPEQASLEDYIAAYEEAGYSNQYWAGDGDLATWKELLVQYKGGTLEGVYDNGIYKHTDGRIYYLKEGDVQGNALSTGILSNHNVSLSGGTEKLRFRVSGNLSFEDGPMITNKDKFRRNALTSFVSADITDWYTQELTMYYTDTKTTALFANIRDPFATRLISWYPEGYMPKEIIGTEKDLIIDSPRNSYLISPISTANRSVPRIMAKTILKPLKNWDIIAEYTFNQENYRYQSYTGITEYADVQLAKKTVPSDPTRDLYTINNNIAKYNALNLYTNYKIETGMHKVGIMLGFNQEQSWYGFHNSSIEGQAVPTVPSFGGGTGIKNISDGYTEYSIRGSFGRLTYSFADKYLLTANARYDGSSKFPKVNRFGFFPSISLGWRVGQENFMSWSHDWLDDLKIRASYGSIGNQNIAPYGYVASMGIGEGTVWLSDNKKITYISSPGLIRSNYTWEKVNTLNFGVDLTALRNRLITTFDWYQRDTQGMLSAGAELPATVGTGAPQQNIADMRTTGWELAVNWRDQIADWRYNVGFNIYDHISWITKFNNLSGSLNNWYVGRDLGDIWGYEADGFYSIDDFDMNEAVKNVWVLKEGIPSINGFTVQPGDMKFKDLDQSGVIDNGASTLEKPGDMKIIGNTTSRYQFGANFGAGYKGFDLNVMLQGVGKRDYWLSGSSLFPFGAAGSDGVFQPLYYNQTDYWTAVSYDPKDPQYMVAKNPNAKLFRIYKQGGNAGSNARTSTKYLQNASYLRVKNATLSYSFPTTWIKRLSLNQFRLYVSVENLGTFTSLPKGYDPESLSWSYPFYRTWSVGANISF